jgi:hypothetical protein
MATILTTTCYCLAQTVGNRAPYKLAIVRHPRIAIVSLVLLKTLCPHLPASSRQFQGNLEERNVHFGIREFKEVLVVDCDAEETGFHSHFQFAIFLLPDVEEREIEALSKIFQEVYNDLIEDYCDPLDRCLSSLNVQDYIED